MKNVIPILSLMLVIVFSSCEKETIEQTEVTPQNLELKVDTESVGKSFDANQYLESRMEWLAFLTAKVLDNDASKIGQINSLMGLDNIITVSELFGTSNPGFETQFRDLLYAEIYFCFPDPDHDRDKPDPPIGQTGNGFIDNVVMDNYVNMQDNSKGGGATAGGSGCSDPDDPAVVELMNYFLNEHCIELYFPNGQITYNGFGFGTPNGNNYITSTAHPLNNDNHNTGVKRLHKNMPYPSRGYTTIVSVDPAFVAANSNVIVARPYILLGSCAYSEFGDIDFTDFLD